MTSDDTDQLRQVLRELRRYEAKARKRAETQKYLASRERAKGRAEGYCIAIARIEKILERTSQRVEA